MKEKYFVLLVVIGLEIISFFVFKNDKKEVKEEFQYNFTFPFFKEEKKEEYLDYQKKNELSLKDAIIQVNIGLNHPFYENTSMALDMDKITMLVNKYHYVTKDYYPNDLIKINNLLINKETYEHYLKMNDDMEKDSLQIRIISAYRSYDYQDNLYNNYLKNEKKEVVDTYSARAGYSEHQTGLAIDVDNNVLNYNHFYLTKEFIWMQENAYKYGFILRYPKNKENITGYIYEPWHYRYVGEKIAGYIHEHNITYEEYYYEFLDQNN